MISIMKQPVFGPPKKGKSQFVTLTGDIKDDVCMEEIIPLEILNNRN